MKTFSSNIIGATLMEKIYKSPIDEFTSLEFVEEDDNVIMYIVCDNNVDRSILSINIPKEDLSLIIRILRSYRPKKHKDINDIERPKYCIKCKKKIVEDSSIYNIYLMKTNKKWYCEECLILLEKDKQKRFDKFVKF